MTLPETSGSCGPHRVTATKAVAVLGCWRLSGPKDTINANSHKTKRHFTYETCDKILHRNFYFAANCDCDRRPPKGAPKFNTPHMQEETESSQLPTGMIRKFLKMVDSLPVDIQRHKETMRQEIPKGPIPILCMRKEIPCPLLCTESAGDIAAELLVVLREQHRLC